MGISTEKAKKNTKKTDEKKVVKRGKTPVELMNEEANKVSNNTNKEVKDMKDTSDKMNDPESLENLMDPKPSEIMEQIRSKKGDAVWRISFTKSTTVGELKEFLSVIPDDTLVRISGQTNGFAQMDTTYPDLNFCVPEEHGCCDSKEHAVHMPQVVIDWAEVLCDMYETDEEYREALEFACKQFDLNPDAMIALISTIAESTTTTAIESTLYDKFLRVAATTDAYFCTLPATDKKSCECDDECIMKDKGFTDFLQNVIRSDDQKRKILSRVESIIERNKLHLIIRSKKKGKKFKKLSDEDLRMILQEVIPEGVSEFRVARRYSHAIDVEYSLNVKNPFGKRPKKDEVAEVYCSACDCDGCDMMESCDGGAIPEMYEETEGTTIVGELHDAKCVPDDEDDD